MANATYSFSLWFGSSTTLGRGNEPEYVPTLKSEYNEKSVGSEKWSKSGQEDDKHFNWSFIKGIHVSVTRSRYRRLGTWVKEKGDPRDKIWPHKGIPDFPDYNTVNVSIIAQDSGRWRVPWGWNHPRRSYGAHGLWGGHSKSTWDPNR